MLPPFIIDYIRQREEEQSRYMMDMDMDMDVRPQPTLELPVPMHMPIERAEPAPVADEAKRGVIIIDLLGY